jgi:hypothetical protein
VNLAQCIPGEWVQDGCPVRHKPKRPPEAPAPIDHGPARKLEPLQEEIDERMASGFGEAIALTRAAVARDPAPGPRPRKARRITDYPWPRGKESLRYRVLERVGRAGEKGIRSGALHAGLQDKGATTLGDVCATLRRLVGDKYAERSGTPRLYRYSITELGREALEA